MYVVLMSFFILQEYIVFFCLEILFNKMFGEVFLIEFLYKEQKYIKYCRLFIYKKILNDEKEIWKKQFLDVEYNLFFFDKMEN